MEARRRKPWEKALREYKKAHGDIEQRLNIRWEDKIIPYGRLRLTTKETVVVKIYFWHKYSNQSFRDLAKEFKLSRNTVKKYFCELFPALCRKYEL
jgi:DNA-directed RNA polymerase sigma subunit (sigma70/sigma32)